MKTLRPRSRAALVVPGLLLSVVLTGCGGGDDGDGDTDGDASGSPTITAATDAPTSPTDTPTDTPTDDAGIPLQVGDPCQATVTASGAIDKKWTSEGSVSVSTSAGPPAVYQSASGATVLTVYAAGNGFEDSVILNDGSDSYGTVPGTKGLEIADDGSGAAIVAELVVPGSDDDTVQVVATFTCS